MQPAWILYRVFDDQAVSVLCRAYDEVRASLPALSPETIATAVLAAAENGETQLDRVRAAAIEALFETVH